MNAKQIRQTYLDFFEKKGHKIVPSAPMVVKNDPTLMFNNAGMNQFKDLFLGNSAIKDPRVANSQKCLRVSGKHNDLEEVGVDTYHHTMFEMLGNWSFGDYFKKEAIEWAWELLTDVFKIDKDRLYVTIFEGDQEDGLAIDQEATDIWANIIDPNRIIPSNKKDNFWEMGETGPCGPCSEIHVDLRPDSEREKIDGKSLVNEDHPQVIEIWNLVFMQFNRMADKSLVPLKHKHIDTGMGFERLAMALQGKTSNYDTDIFQPIIQHLERLSNLVYQTNDQLKNGEDTDINIAMRVVADHVRTIAFSIADGQIPSNNGAGYVIRRILRRAVRYGYQILNLKEPFIHELVPTLVKEMGEAFPELAKQQDLITKVIKEEEVSFLRTLAQGIKRLDNICTQIKENNKTTIEGPAVFELYDTFGFPIDLTNLIAQNYGLTIDEEGFKVELEKQKSRSRKASETTSGDWVILKEDDKEEFIGYDYTDGEVYITRYRKTTNKDKTIYQIVLNNTPFYPEGGGQVGDKGQLVGVNETVDIFDTKKENNLIIHFTKKMPEFPEVKFVAQINTDKRSLTTNNHSATHLLHEALRNVLGTHVEQKGSLVNDQYLRFDFSHFGKVTNEELIQIEALVNDKIRQAIPLNEFRNIPIAKAEEMGAMMLFGEKYGDTVRVIQFDSSIELCGGIHVQNTAKIGQFKIVSESSTAAGIRRIEAITSITADKFVQDQLDTITAIKVALKNPKNIAKAITDLQAQNNALAKEIEALKAEKAKGVKKDLINAIENKNGVNFLAQLVDIDSKSIKDLAFQLKGEVENLFMVLGSNANDKTTISVAVSDSLIKDKDLHAGNIVRELAKEINGGGGGQPSFATAGGKNPNGLESALKKAENYLA
ncbi:MAG: alanine--tRNA ligase [Flavobacteriales bacterium]|jgi:alanyl-tRNA synthetase|nr:alanine--tRNA ligase [Flavobacteriales bacterium]